MSDEPSKSLKATSISAVMTESECIHHFTFDDGSSWTCSPTNGWMCEWKAPEPARRVQSEPPVESIAWSEHPEAVLNRKIGSLEAERDAARRTAVHARDHAGKLEAKVKVLEADLLTAREAMDFQVKQRANLQSFLADWERVANKFASNPEGPRLVTSPSELEDFLERNQETEQHLESQLKAWQDAASTQLVEDPRRYLRRAASTLLVEDSDEERVPCQTPEQLIERMRHLYRWASSAEERAKAAEKDAINERESHSRTRKNADGWCERACAAEANVRRLKSEVKAEEALEPNRVIKTAHSLITEAAQNPRTFHQKSHLFRLAKDAIEAIYGGSTPKLEPYRTKGEL